VVFTLVEFSGKVFTVHSVVLRLSVGAISVDGVPGRWDSVGCSNIGSGVPVVDAHDWQCVAC
jgi:hypothetical protein